MSDTSIRTFSTIVGDSDARSRDLAAFLPADWEPGTRVLLVADLPEGAEVCSVERPDFPVDSPIVAFIHAPKPEPDPPATERVPWHEGMGRIAQAPNDGDWFTIDTVRCDYTLGGPVVEGDQCTLPADDDGMVKVLVDPAPTGDDEPSDDANAREHRERTQADTPAPQGRWIVDYDEPVWKDESVLLDLSDLNSPHAPYNSVVAARAALVALVRRDGTAPPEHDAVWLWLDQNRRTTRLPWRGSYIWPIDDVLAAVRALRDGGAR